MTRGEAMLACGIGMFAFLAISAAIGFGMWGMPQYNIYSKRLDGIAKLQHAESERQIAVLEAKAKDDSAGLLAEAEVKRAEGVAKANKIIGDSLAGNEAYLHYLWIQELAAAGHVIYVPTEANMPIMEAGRAVEK